MATPNYGYEKRQRELAKKRKKEDKLKAKAERKAGHEPLDGEGEGENLPAHGEDAAPVDGAPAEPGSPPAN